MRSLLTGSRGLLGGHILDKLNEMGVDVVAPTREKIDLRDSNATLRFMESEKVDGVIHCAALVGGIAENIRRPGDFILQNLLVDSSVISASLTLQIPKFLYFSSSCTYPVEAQQPFKETSILTGPPEITNSSYALAKIAGTKSIEHISSQYSLQWNTLVLSNIYGPRDNFDPNSSHLLAAIIRKLLLGKSNSESTTKIWGDGLARREFTYVGDVASFVAKVWVESLDLPRTMNIGAGVDFSVTEYYEKVCKELDYFPRFEFDPSIPSGIKSKLMDSTIASKFGWQPSTSLELGLRNTIEWYKEHGI
jgi:GDP-L-fucose synthase